MNKLVVSKRSGARFDVYVGRPTAWGNPFSHMGGTLAKYKVATRDESISKYEARCFVAGVRRLVAMQRS